MTASHHATRLTQAPQIPARIRPENDEISPVPTAIVRAGHFHAQLPKNSPGVL